MGIHADGVIIRCASIVNAEYLKKKKKGFIKKFVVSDYIWIFIHFCGGVVVIFRSVSLR